MLVRVVLFCVLMGSGGLLGCSSPRLNNTRLTGNDLVAMTDRMTDSLITSKAIASRNARNTDNTDSLRWVIVFDRVSNQTNDIIPDDQKWAFVARLRALLGESQVLSERHLTFVLSHDAVASVNKRQNPGEQQDQNITHRLVPTHAMTATFYSLTAADQHHRRDVYLCAFQLLDLSNGQVLWEDKYELKRSVVKNVLD